MLNNKNQIGNQSNNEGIIINLQLINPKIYLTTNINEKEIINNLGKFFQDAIKSKIVDIKYNNSNQNANDKNNEGVKYFIDKNYKEALKCFEEAIKIDDSISEVYYNLGNTKLFLYNEYIKNAEDLEKIFNEVRLDYTKAINIDKKDFRYYYNRGTLYALSKKYNMAIDDLNQSIDIDNTHPEPYINRANIYLILNDNQNEEYLKKSEEDLKKAEELSNIDDKYLTCVLYNNLGNTYLSNGDFYNAKKYYKKSLEKDDKYIYAILGLANIDIYNYQYSKNNNYYEKALNKFNEAEKIKSNFHGIYYNKSHLLLNKGRIERNKESYLEAIKLAEKALECLNNKKIEDNTTKALYYYSIGIIYSELYDYNKNDKAIENKVIENYKKSIELNEDDYNPYYNLANFYDKIENKTEAINYYNKSISINPNHESSYNNRAAILMEKGIYDEAILDLNNVIKINNNNAGAYYNLGVIYSYQEKYQLAIDNFNKCINLSEGNNYFKKISYYNLGIIVGRMGNNEEAVRNLIRAYEIEDNIIDNNKILKTIKEEAKIYKNKVAIDYLNSRKIYF